MPVAIVERKYPFPFRTRKSSSLTSMILLFSGKVESCWLFYFKASLSLFTFIHWRRNGNPLQCSCLENPRNGGAWWAAIYGVAQSQTQLKRLSSSSSMDVIWRWKWQPTPVFLPGESQGRRSLVGCHFWGRTESNTTEAT